MGKRYKNFSIYGRLGIQRYSLINNYKQQEGTTMTILYKGKNKDFSLIRYIAKKYKMIVSKDTTVGEMEELIKYREKLINAGKSILQKD